MSGNTSGAGQVGIAGHFPWMCIFPGLLLWQLWLLLLLTKFHYIQASFLQIHWGLKLIYGKEIETSAKTVCINQCILGSSTDNLSRQMDAFFWGFCHLKGFLSLLLSHQVFKYHWINSVNWHSINVYNCVNLNLLQPRGRQSATGRYFYYTITVSTVRQKSWFTLSFTL